MSEVKVGDTILVGVTELTLEKVQEDGCYVFKIVNPIDFYTRMHTLEEDVKSKT